ncbi:MAG: hypothetical protein N2C14_15840 [Planctomycetales bacterium]
MQRSSIIRAARGVLPLAWGVLAALATTTNGEKQDPATPRLNSVRLEALRETMRDNLGYCEEWLDGQDHESLEETTGALLILTEAMARKNDSSDWKTQTTRLADQVNVLKQAAHDKKSKESRAAAASLRKTVDGLKFPAALAKPVPGTKPGGFKAMMQLLDGVYGEAKRAVLFGETEKVKTNARALAELLPLVKPYRADARWSERADATLAAAEAVIDSKLDDPKKLKAVLLVVGKRCDACHKNKK